jgi:hypothetical protein
MPCGRSVHPLVAVAQVIIALPFVIPSEADLSRRAVEGSAVLSFSPPTAPPGRDFRQSAAQRRDLQFHFPAQQKSLGYIASGFHFSINANCRSLRCASVGMTNSRAAAHLGSGGGGRTEPAQQQPTRFRLPAFSLTHSASCAVQKALRPLIWTALIRSRPCGTHPTICEQSLKTQSRTSRAVPGCVLSRGLRRADRRHSVSIVTAAPRSFSN